MSRSGKVTVVGAGFPLAEGEGVGVGEAEAPVTD